MAGNITIGRKLRQTPINTTRMDRNTTPKQPGVLYLSLAAMCTESGGAETNEVGHRPVHQED